MNYDVRWDATAENELAAIWLAATDRAAVTHAAAWIEGQLVQTPLRLGTPQTSSVHRVAFQHPLGVEFEVIEDDKRVIVRAVFTVN